jgi:predicted nucleotide-binding protein (sugar kinase/HSP70/actin superfamily)
LDDVVEALAKLKEDDVSHYHPFVDLEENLHVTEELLEVIQDLEGTGYKWNKTLVVGLSCGDKV